MCSSKRFVNDNDFTHDCDDETFECGAAFLKILFDHPKCFSHIQSYSLEILESQMFSLDRYRDCIVVEAFYKLIFSTAFKVSK